MNRYAVVISFEWPEPEGAQAIRDAIEQVIKDSPMTSVLPIGPIVLRLVKRAQPPVVHGCP